jgi:hypothetical protein
VGALVRVDLKLTGESEGIEVDLSREVANRLNLLAGETVYARPRKMRVFADDYVI